MTTATLNISKNLTVVTDNSVYNANLSEIINIANKYNVFTIKGITKTAKFNKYLSDMIAKGYNVICENWMRENYIADGSMDFSIQLSK